MLRVEMKAGERHSPVWDHAAVLLDKNDTPSTKWVCFYCYRIFKDAGNTTNVASHLKDAHSNSIASPQVASKLRHRLREGGQGALTAFGKTVSNKSLGALALWLMASGRPFSIVQDPCAVPLPCPFSRLRHSYFQRFVALLNNGFSAEPQDGQGLLHEGFRVGSNLGPAFLLDSHPPWCGWLACLLQAVLPRLDRRLGRQELALQERSPPFWPSPSLSRCVQARGADEGASQSLVFPS